MIFNNRNVLADELVKAIKSFEHLKRRHSMHGTISRPQINIWNSFAFFFGSLPRYCLTCSGLYFVKRLIHHFSTYNVLHLASVAVMHGHTLKSIYIYVRVSLTKLVKQKTYILKWYHGGNDCELLDHSVKVHRDLHLHFWLLDKNLCKRRFSLFCKKMMKTRTRRK